MNPLLKELEQKREELERLIDITFFIPCLNEEDSIIATLDKLVEVANEFSLTVELLVYNDGSTDHTKPLVEKYAQDHPELFVHLINNEKRKGLGYNYIDGAFKGFGKYYMMICGDNAETTESLREILKRKGSADIVIPYFGDMDARSFFRRKLSRLFTFIVNFLNGYHIKYYNGTVLHERFNVMRWHPSSSGFAYQAEMITIMLDEHKTYCHVQVANRDREQGVSRAFYLQNIFSVTHSLLQIFFRRIRRMIWPL